MDIAELRLQCLKMVAEASPGLDPDSHIEAARKLEAYLMEMPGRGPAQIDPNRAGYRPSPGGTLGGWVA